MMPKHPITEGKAAIYHSLLAIYYLGGAWFHLVSIWRHWQDRDYHG